MIIIIRAVTTYATKIDFLKPSLQDNLEGYYSKNIETNTISWGKLQKISENQC